MPDTKRRLVLRVSLKLLGLAALLLILFTIIGTLKEPIGDKPEVPVLSIDLRTVPSAQPQRIEWTGGNIQLLHMPESPRPYLFFDRGGNLNCPLSWQARGTSNAPQQPWPGGFRDQCSGIWYLYNGQVVSGQVHKDDLQSPSYTLQNEYLLEIGSNRDNAAPAR